MHLLVQLVAHFLLILLAHWCFTIFFIALGDGYLPWSVVATGTLVLGCIGTTFTSIWCIGTTQFYFDSAHWCNKYIIFWTTGALVLQVLTLILRLTFLLGAAPHWLLSPWLAAWGGVVDPGFGPFDNY